MLQLHTIDQPIAARGRVNLELLSKENYKSWCTFQNCLARINLHSSTQHHLIKEKLNELTQQLLPEKVLLIWLVTRNTLYSLRNNQKDIVMIMSECLWCF